MSRLTSMIRKWFPPKVPLPPLYLSAEDDAKIRGVLDSQPRNGIFVDLGANVGNVTAVALEYGHRVFAFEPGPAWPILKARFGQDSRVELINKCIGARPRVVDFYVRRDGNTYDPSFVVSYELGRRTRVEVVPIVEFLRSVGRPVMVVKMDIEGAEAECLEAVLESGIHREVGLFIVETHERFSADIANRIHAIRKRIAVEDISNIDLTWT